MGQHIFVPHNESVTTPLFNISSMKIISSGWVLTGLMLVSFASLQAQMPTDAIMMAKGQLCVAATYTNDTWDEYWEGTLKRTNGNIGTLTRQTVSPMFALGLNERVNVMAALPWVSTKSSGGQLKGVSGFQDFGVWVKATAIQGKEDGSGFTFHPVVGVSFPASNYLEDYGPYSLGLGAANLSLAGVLQYKLAKGPYVRGYAGYNIRGNAKIERDYYYTTHGVYSDEVDMPNAVTYAATLGTWLFNNNLQIEATYDGLNSLDGFDIRKQTEGFPANEMDFTRVGGFAHYHIPAIPGLGIIAQYTPVLTGRNVGQSTAITGGISYIFGLWNKEQAPKTIN